MKTFLICTCLVFLMVADTYERELRESRSEEADTHQKELCSDLNGFWLNELGSVMEVVQPKNGELYGKYWTAVNINNGSYSPTNWTALYGTSSYKQAGDVFGINVMWMLGVTMTSFTGQCFVCGGVETLKTSWLLKISASCANIWNSTYIGQNTFKRTKPSGAIDPRSQPHSSSPVIHDASAAAAGAAAAAGPCGDLSGYWFDRFGAEMLLWSQSDNIIKGQYRTAAEKCKGEAGRHWDIYGLANKYDPSSTVALSVVWNNGSTITGWAGQCHVCKEGGAEVLQLTWLSRSKENMDDCDSNEFATNYGEAKFTRGKPSSVGCF